LKPSFIEGVNEFIKIARKQRRKVKDEGGIRCPCDKCMCGRVSSPNQIKVHLYKHGFQPNYLYWTDHSEKVPRNNLRNVSTSSQHKNNGDPFAREIKSLCKLKMSPEEEEVEEASELVTREIKKRKETDAAVKKALQFAKGIEIPAKVLAKESTVEAAQLGLELTKNLQ